MNAVRKDFEEELKALADRAIVDWKKNENRLSGVLGGAIFALLGAYTLGDLKLIAKHLKAMGEEGLEKIKLARQARDQ